MISLIVQMCIPEEPYILLQTTNVAGLLLSEDKIGLIELYQIDVPLLGQETPIHGLQPGQLGVIIEMNNVEYIFYNNSEAEAEHAQIIQAEADLEADTNSSIATVNEDDAVLSEMDDTWVLDT